MDEPLLNQFVGQGLSAPILNCLFTEDSERSSLPGTSNSRHHARVHPIASTQLERQNKSEQGPHIPPRAYPLPKVTDLFCRIPLPTLFYGPDDPDLGDLKR